MKRYIDGITPIVQKIFELTNSKQMKWERTGDKVFRCVDIRHSLSLEISKGSSFGHTNVSVKLYSDSKLEFEYSPGITQRFPEFDTLLLQLYDVVEEENIKRVTSDFSKFMQYFVKK